MLDVREQQLLMLLLVVKTKGDRFVRFVVLEQPKHVLVYIPPILEHLLDGWARDETPLSATVPLTGLDIV